MLIYILFLVFFIVSYGLLHYYVGIRLWQCLLSCQTYISAKLYWLLFWVLAFAYLFARIGQRRLPVSIKNFFTQLGSYWMAIFIILFACFVVLDIIRLLLYFFGHRLTLTAGGPFWGAVVLLVASVLFIVGTWNVYKPAVTTYELTIAKTGGQIKELNAVLVSDLHLGGINTRRFLSKMTERINKLNPDVVLIAGDIIEEEAAQAVKHDYAGIFRQLHAVYGVYAVPGNHEYYGGEAEDILNYLEQGGIKVLRDSYSYVADSFYIVGRDDPGRHYGNNNSTRNQLSEIMEGIERNKLIILLNHQPIELDEAVEQGVDLQLSGHTHRGQIFPASLITARIFEKDWGHIQKGDYHLIVTSGYGVWGPPLRIGSRAEIVQIKIKFADNTGY